ncbi:MAG: hypothetical protein AB4426_03380 [Xenococcaceae cyanobacterium]
MTNDYFSSQFCCGHYDLVFIPAAIYFVLVVGIITSRRISTENWHPVTSGGVSVVFNQL